MAVDEKPYGDLRICIDPQPLNEHFKVPTVDVVLHKLDGAKVFTKLDVKQAYLHVKLDELSSILATMITPYVRYKRIDFLLV